MEYRTVAAYVSGGICGAIWWPVGEVCGKLHEFDCRDRLDRFSDSRGATFRDMLLSELTERGGDFQNARFTADTVIRVERRAIQGPGKYTMHIWERELSALPDCADLVDAEHFVCDFMSEDD